MSLNVTAKGRSVAVMQPYFAPYVGYFNLIAAADIFVFHDDVKYTKKGWINRNRICDGKRSKTISLPLAKDSDFLNINQRMIAQSFVPRKLENEISEFLKGLPFSKDAEALIKLLQDKVQATSNLATSLIELTVDYSTYLKLETEFVKSSDFQIDPTLRGEARVIELCKCAGATHYVNPPGGEHLYSSETFDVNGLSLSFLQPGVLEESTGGEVETSSILSFLAHYGYDQTITDVKSRFILK